MKKFILSILVLISCTQALAKSTELAERAKWLRKTSILLTGQDSMSSDYAQAVRLNQSDWIAFQQSKLNQIFSSVEYSKKLTTEVLEHLGIPAEPSRFDLNEKFATSQLVLQVVKEGAPWSSLFNSRDVYYNRIVGAT